MSIKSEKAKEILAENVNPIATTKVIFYGGDLGKCDITLRAAKQAIIQAESDAEARDRERAARAFCKTVCPKQHEGCSCYGLSCDKRDNFLKHYDNE